MKNATRLIGFLGAIAVVAVVALGWFLGVSPLLAQAAQSDSDRDAVASHNDALRAELAVSREQFENIDEYRARLALLNVMIPDDGHLEELYVAVNDCGVIAGAVGLDSITTGDAIPYQVAAAADGVIVLPGASLQPKLFAVPIQIELAGTPGASLAFVACLQEQWTRTIAITSFQVSAAEKGGISLSGYLFRVTDPAAIPGRLAAPFDDGQGDESAETAAVESDAESEETPDPTATETPAP